MFRRKKPIPPPLEIDIPDPTYSAISLPFVLAEYPRVLLDYLSHSPSISEEQRFIIHELTTSYSQTLAQWIVDAYGWGGLMQASLMAQQVQQQFYQAVGEAVTAGENSLFDFLEKDINEGGNNG